MSIFKKKRYVDATITAYKLNVAESYELFNIVNRYSNDNF